MLFLGRQDSARIAMFDAVARSILATDADVRAASLTPMAADPRTLRVLRHAGYATDVISPRAVTVDDLSWADLVVTVGGERDDWERFLPRTTPHQHEQIDDPVAAARTLQPVDELEPFRASLRVVERACTLLRPPRSTRVPTSPALRPSWTKLPAIRLPDDEPPPSAPSSTKLRTKP